MFLAISVIAVACNKANNMGENGGATVTGHARASAKIAKRSKYALATECTTGTARAGTLSIATIGKHCQTNNWQSIFHSL